VQLNLSMKKQTFAIIFSVIIAALITGFWFYTKNNTFISSTNSNAPVGAIKRMFSNNTALDLWMPKDAKKISDKIYLLEDCTFNFINAGADYNALAVKYKNIECKSLLHVQEQKEGNYVAVNFKLPEPAGFSERFDMLKNKNHIEAATNKLMIALGKFLSDTKNIYGINFSKSTLRDSTLISIKESTTTYPTTAQIYSTIDILKDYAAKNNAKETNVPMLNIYKNELGTYNYMVALPINSFLENKDKIIAKKMLAGGNVILSDEFTGGRYFIDKCIGEIENYKTDHTLMSPAIPFESLITDRRAEADTAKWKTKLYIPIF
jgi:hypothetical protein